MVFYIDRLKNAIKEEGYNNNAMYRGVVFRCMSMPNHDTSFYQHGRKFLWSTFSSTSKFEDTAQKFRRHDSVLFVIDCDGQGLTYNVDLSTISCYSEQEVLLYPYSGFEVRRVEKDRIVLRTYDTVLIDPKFGQLLSEAKHHKVGVPATTKLKQLVSHSGALYVTGIKMLPHFVHWNVTASFTVVVRARSYYQIWNGNGYIVSCGLQPGFVLYVGNGTKTWFGCVRAGPGLDYYYCCSSGDDMDITQIHSYGLSWDDVEKKGFISMDGKVVGRIVSQTNRILEKFNQQPVRQQTIAIGHDLDLYDPSKILSGTVESELFYPGALSEDEVFLLQDSGY
eukprot:TRINITY_DN906_c0_g1_i1.p1 TRINITY_DN906_c0_g1~~TRINITY_DN906_c0_g1_i1.p1  ORF type:complete len:337 (-),score=26.47 TRINITY_DN906_c0_g1_i1:35-1045(-)